MRKTTSEEKGEKKLFLVYDVLGGEVPPPSSCNFLVHPPLRTVLVFKDAIELVSC